MPLLRNVSVSNGLPSELWGLHSSNFYNTAMFGGTQPTWWDACKIRTPAGQQDGHYLVCGIGTGVGVGSPFVLVLGGGSPVAVVAPTLAGLTTLRFQGCTTGQPGSGSAMNTAWFIGPGDQAIVRLDGSQNSFSISSYLSNGSVSGAAWAPSQLAICGLNTSAGSGKVVAYGKRSDTGHKFMSSKSVGDSSTSTWSQITVPGDSNSYVKARQSRGGFTVAITDTGTLDNSTDSSLTAMITDGTRNGVVDMDYSSTDDLFIICDGTSVFTASAGWGGGGHPTWVTRTLPSSVGLPWNVIALDVPSADAPPSELSGGFHTWYMIMAASVGGAHLGTCLFTRDFVQYYAAEIPGLILAATSATAFPVKPHVKFVHDRLFVFTTLGVTVTGKLGSLAEKY